MNRKTFDKNCLLYSYEAQNWPKVESLSLLEIGQWIFYLDDMYFGKIIHLKKEELKKEELTLRVENFRRPGSYYKASFSLSRGQKLRQKPENVLVDPEIKALHPKLHLDLEKFFQIWQKLDGYTLEAKFQKHSPEDIFPVSLQPFMPAFGKWAASGYMTKKDIDFLQEKEFSSVIQFWRSLESMALDEDIPEKLIFTLDYLRSLRGNEGADLPIHYSEWLALQAGFFFDHPEKRAQLAQLKYEH